MGETGFKVSTKDFDVKFASVVRKQIPTLVNDGLFKAAAEALRDADEEDPKLPFLKGDLRGSKQINKNTDLVNLTIEFGFNIVYAARLHEDGLPSWNWSRAGSGPKFLTTKLIRNKEKYMKIVAAIIKSGEKAV